MSLKQNDTWNEQQQELKDEMCSCGDLKSYHIDYCEQCMVYECGCKEYEELDPLEKKLEAIDELMNN